MNCPINEQTANGYPCGRCCFYLPDGKTCPRHGDVEQEVAYFTMTQHTTPENVMRKRKSLPLLGRKAFTLIELLVVVAIIGVLIALLIPAVQAARESARVIHCGNSLRQIGIAMHAYHETHESFPCGAAVGLLTATGGPYGTPTGTREGWRVYILPFLEDRGRYDAFDFDASICDGLDNRLSATRIPCYTCPSDNQQPFDPHMQTIFRWRTSNYCGVSGATIGRRLESNHCGDFKTDGILYPLSGVRIQDIPDGLSQTVVVGEQVNWLRVWTAGAYRTNIYGPGNHYCVFSCKNMTWPLDTDPAERKYNHARPDQNCLFNDIYFSSRHPGGVNFLLADGHVEFIGKKTALKVLLGRATRNGGEVR